MKAAPMLNSVCITRTGMISSQYQVTGWPTASTVAKITIREIPSCCSSIST
jgi:hypothetical protein